jgi:interferon regulatory factor 2
MYYKKPVVIPTVVADCITSPEIDDCGVINLSTSGRQPRHITTSGVTLKTPIDMTPSSVVAAGRHQSERHARQPTRMLMREWLLQQIANKDVPGLEWFDAEKTLIKIPWIHGSTAVWTRDRHCRLFEKWAVYTGKYIPARDKPNPRRWKANFRCALNSLPDVKEERELGSQNGEHGFKVYRFTSSSRSSSTAKTCRSDLIY